MSNLLTSIKKAAKEAVEEAEPAGIIFGTVVSASPLKVQVEQKLLLTKEFLILTKNVIDYEAELEIEWQTETEQGHKHEIKKIKKVKFKNAVKKGDKLILIKQQGGQKYVVLDKIMS